MNKNILHNTAFFLKLIDVLDFPLRLYYRYGSVGENTKEKETKK